MPLRPAWIWLGAFVTACSPPPSHEKRCLEMPASESPVVARVGATAITQELVEKRLREQGSSAARLASDPARLRRFVEDQIRFELLAQAAFERGLDKDPDVVEAARKVMVKKLLQQDLGAQVMGGETTEDQIRAYYDAHKDDYLQPAKRRVAHVQLDPTPDGKAQAQSLIDRLMTQTPEEARTTFKLLALQHSLDKETSRKGGELPGFVAQDELAEKLGPSFAAEAFALKSGAISPAPVQSTRGWHVLVLLAEREGLARSLDEVREEIRDRLMQSERAQLFDRYLRDIRQRHPVALYEEQLSPLEKHLAGGPR